MTEQMETAVDTTIDTVETKTTSEGVETVSETNEAAEQTGEAAEVVTDASEATQDMASGNNAAEDGVIFTPVYNGAVTPIKASDTDRVTTLLQKGMKFEHMADDLEKLHQLTAAYGAKNPTEMLNMMLGARERAQKDEYVRKYGKEAGERLFELEKERQQSKRGSFKEADAAADKASREALNNRLADELVELQSNHVHIGSIKDVPQRVIDTALQKGIPLLDAYNRYILNEQKRTASAVQKQAVNQKAATGSLADGGSEVSDPVWEAFVNGAKRAQRG